MNWITRNNMYLSAPYRIYSGVQGFDAWHYGKHGCFCLGKQYATLSKAKDSCEQHKVSHA